MEKIPTEQAWEVWVQEPVTLAHRNLLRRWVGALHEQWENRNYQGSTAHETATMNAVALAQVDLLNKLINLDYQQLEDGLTDEEHIGTETPGPRGPSEAL